MEYADYTLHWIWKDWRLRWFTDVTNYDSQMRKTLQMGPFYWVRHYVDPERHCELPPVIHVDDLLTGSPVCKTGDGEDD